VTAFKAQLKMLEPMEVAFIAMTGPFEQIPDAMDRLYRWVQASSLVPEGMPHAVYYTMPGDDGDFSEAVWELWAPVASSPVELGPNEHGLGIKHVGSAVVASTVYTGPYDGLAPVYGLLMDWIADQGYQIVGPPREIYFSDPVEVPPEEYVTEIQMPVEKAQATLPLD